MQLRFVFLLVLWFGLGAAAQAQIRINSASYGAPKPGRSVDVKDLVQAKANLGTGSFPVGPNTMGGSPNLPGVPNYLVVEYTVYGQKFVGRGRDGEMFYFNGLRGPGPVAPVAPAASSRVRFENNYGRAIYLYELNRWGAWNWKAQLDPGAVYAANARPGDTWAVTDRNGRTLRQVTITRGLGYINLR